MKVVVLGGYDRLKARVEQMAKKYNIAEHRQCFGLCRLGDRFYLYEWA
jgi:hypothetical protein